MRLYDSSGLQVVQRPAGNAVALPTALNLSPNPWDPATGALLISQGTWSYAFDGKDGSGALLRNGVYLLTVSDPSGATVQATLTVLGGGQKQVALVAGPNPVRPGQALVLIKWSPITLLELKIYGLDGGLVRSVGVAAPPYTWDLRTQAGGLVANGIYVVAARLPGERHPQTFKLMVAR